MERSARFLEIIAERYFDTFGKEIRNVAFIFPNRRSSVYFRNILGDLSPDPIWSPSIYSINDLVRTCSGLEIPESYELIFELFDIYRKEISGKPAGIEKFFQTGKTILSDFSEIDKNLADAKLLFRSLKELQGLEYPPKDTNKTEGSTNYKNFWIDLEKLYHPFRESLENRHLGYEGMAFRKVAEDISLITDKGWKKIVFAGFNALSGTESSIMSQLKKTGIADIFTEADKYFIDDQDQEAGDFFRKHSAILDTDKILSPFGKGLQGGKKIEIIETTSDTGQVKITGIKLSELKDGGEDLQHTAVILPDENLLFPILNSLPENLGKGNISIGYPLRQTSAYSLYDALFELCNRKDNLFYRTDLGRVLDHPYIRMISDEEMKDLSVTLKEGTGTFLDKFRPTGNILSAILSDIKYSSDFMDLILSLFDRLREVVTAKKVNLPGIEREFVFQFHTLIGKLKEIIERTGSPVSLKGFRRMFNDLIGTVHIPFTGEPLEGLQILGVLEMQNLNFKNLFILSMHEDIFPSGKFTQTFIPQDVRKATGLPVSGEREAIFAYHFYRMIANSENITLLYSSASPGSGKGEKSRFIDQIFLEYRENNPDADIRNYNAEFQLDIQKGGAIKISKTDDTLTLLKKLSFSATSLRTWIECPLRFWFRYVLRLKDDLDTDDAHDFAKFGSIFHRVLEKIYLEAIGREIDKSYFEKFHGERLDSLIRLSFHGEGITEIDTGMNLITFKVIEEFIRKFFKNEQNLTPFRINSLEKEIKEKEFIFNINEKPQTIRFTGTIDRIDEREGVLRIIDYKTGKMNSTIIKNGFEDTDFVKHKEVFQLLFYANLLKGLKFKENKFKLGIYPFKTLSDKLLFIKIKGEEIIDKSILNEFDKVLEAILQEIFDPGIPFTQTEDEKICRYCLHKNICERSPEKQKY